jgi:hypothetical protein
MELKKKNYELIALYPMKRMRLNEPERKED